MGKHKFLSLFGLVFLLPVVLAYTFLKMGWFHAGVTNQGRWFTHETKLLAPITSGAAHWRLVYALPSSCEAACTQVLQLMQNIQLALGRKNVQLDLVLLASHKPILALPAQMQVVQQRVPAEISDKQLILVEQQGLALLDYPLPQNQTQLPMLGKALLADLQKLMKYDRGPV